MYEKDNIRSEFIMLSFEIIYGGETDEKTVCFCPKRYNKP